MKCEYCGNEESLPFVCNYCGGAFCGEHRLPESHACKGDLSSRRLIIAPPSTTTFNWSDSAVTTPPTQVTKGVSFSKVEVQGILVAWLALGFAFLLVLYQGFQGIPKLVSDASSNPLDVVSLFLILLVTVGSGFVLHELSHKFTAERYGFWAEFRVWPVGLVLAMITALIGFLFAAPGATYINGAGISDEQNGVISAAGPLVNVGVAGIFLPVLLLAHQGTLVEFAGFEGVFINCWLALFNMIPVMPFDGAKVFRWNKVIWAAIFIPLLVTVLYILNLPVTL